MTDLVSALKDLPIALGLMDREGRIIARFGALSDVFIDVPATSDAEPAKRWRVFDANGDEVLMHDWPGPRAMRGEVMLADVIGLHTDARGQSTMVRISTRAIPPGHGDVCAISLLQPLNPGAGGAGGMEDPLRSGFPETLFTTIGRLCSNDDDRRALFEAFKLGEPSIADEAKPLTRREAEVLLLVAWGYNRKEIAVRLGIGARTVEFHQSAGMRRLGMESRRDVVEHAARLGWMLTPP